MRPLVWLRSDLRIRDNPALYEAARRATRGVVAVFISSLGQWIKKHDWSPARIDLIARTLEELAAELDKRGIPLTVQHTPTFRRVPGLLAKLMKQYECDALYFNHEYEVNEQRRDEMVMARMARDGYQAHTFHDQTIVNPYALRTASAGRPYSVFTPFYKAWVRHLTDTDIPSPLGLPKKQTASIPGIPALDVSGIMMPGVSDSIRRAWPAGPRAMGRRLKRFINDTVDGYPDHRDRPDLDATSRLSPYLAVGSLSARQCLGAIQKAGHVPEDDTWLRQLAWREFYRHVLVGFPRVSMNRAFKRETERIAWRDDAHDCAAWAEGRTGYPIVDAAMRSLNEHAWLHNRLRMIVSMFLTKHLLIDWRIGERYFMQHLIDGDLANNNGGWQWSASTGVDAAPYFRIFNPWSQSKRFDPEGVFIKANVSELRDVPAAALHDPLKLAAVLESEQIADYPRVPIIAHAAGRARALAAFKTTN
ncbi:MAG: deoxyribodipyrimidine photo-lyase [Planctomycetes bacterium]|nr:deoxyribodipyrimidine photo-lyase [Planctomycetota bacterium]NOG56090.1 deoxyribodipyrimidine photo-lyase [Planctomycetota bacterium]